MLACCAALVALLALLPLGFVVVDTRRASAGPRPWRAGRSGRASAELLRNTVGCSSAASLLSLRVIGIGGGLAGRAHRPARAAASWTVLLVAPLAVPAFVNSFGWVSLAPGVDGLRRRASLIVTLSYFPLVYLPVAAALRGLDPALEETRRARASARGATFAAGGAAAAAPGAARRRAAGRAAPARRVRRAADAALPDLHHRDLRPVPVDLQRPGGDHAGRRARRCCCLLLLLAETPAARPRPLRPGRRRRAAAGRAGAGSAGSPSPALAGAGRCWSCSPLGVPIGQPGPLAASPAPRPRSRVAELRRATAHVARPRRSPARRVTIAARAPGRLARGAPPRPRDHRCSSAAPTSATRCPASSSRWPWSPCRIRLRAGRSTRPSPLLVAAYAILFLPRAMVSLRAALAQAPPVLDDVARALGAGPLGDVPPGHPAADRARARRRRRAGVPRRRHRADRDPAARPDRHPDPGHRVLEQQLAASHYGAAAPYAALLMVLSRCPATLPADPRQPGGDAPMTALTARAASTKSFGATAGAARRRPRRARRGASPPSSARPAAARPPCCG